MVRPVRSRAPFVSNNLLHPSGGCDEKDVSFFNPNKYKVQRLRLFPPMQPPDNESRATLFLNL
jgi:hypothetical protein